MEEKQDSGIRKRRCPYCGLTGYPDRTVILEERFDGRTGEKVSEYGSDYFTCAYCGTPFGSGYGAVHIPVRSGAEAG